MNMDISKNFLEQLVLDFNISLKDISEKSGIPKKNLKNLLRKKTNGLSNKNTIAIIKLDYTLRMQSTINLSNNQRSI